MPNVVVYVPAKAWKALEERGLDPAVVVREFAKKGYEVSERVLPEREVVGVVAENPPTAERAQKAEGGDSRTPDQIASRSESAPKKRMHPCKHHLPPSKHCPYGCDG